LIAQGAGPEEARRRARLALGGPEQVKEQCRDTRGIRWLEDLLQDLRYGMRMLLKNPGFTMIATITLALGIGANTTIFSFINGLALRPIAGVKEPGRLVAVYTSDRSSGQLYSESSYPDYVDFRDQADAFSGLAAYSETTLTLTGADEAERLNGAHVTGNYFETLGVEARAGRTLRADDSTPGATPVAVISHGLWRRRFGSEASAIGRTITLDRRVYTVVGIAPESFRGLRLGAPPEFWLPMTTENVSAHRGDRILNIVGRLKAGVSLKRAQSQITTIGAQLARAYPKTNLGTLAAPDKPRPMTVVGESLIPPEGLQYAWTAFGLLLAVVGLVLLIACANVATLLLSRASTRRREIAVRLAIGASRWRLVRQLLTESLLLALLGGAGGLILAFWCSGLLPAFFSPNEVGGLDVSLDWRVLVFTLAASLLTGALFGLAPALESSRPDLVTALKEGAEIHGWRRRITLRQALVVTQVALSLTLLIGAGLFLQSLSHALRFDPGFAPQNLLLASLETRGATMSKEQGQAFYRQVLERIGSLPGAQSATLAKIVPIGGGGQRSGVHIEGYEPQSNEDLELNCNVVGLNYFNTMGIPLTNGRDFNAMDGEGSPGVVIVNEELARRYFPGQTPIGKRLRFGSGPYREIVGVARSAKYRQLREAPLPFIYIPLGQEYTGGVALLVRAVGDLASLAPAVRREIRGLNSDVPFFAVRTMSEQIGEALAVDRMIAALLGAFGGIALLLAVVSIYSVVSCAVAQRVREIGVRVALGARGADVLKLMIGQGMKLVMIGVAFGLAMSFALTRLTSSLLFEVSATDPATFTGVAALLTTAALAACYIPARRAMKVDPMIALRCE
ncbi:MAG: ABC transporter permease, partial [Blastocatellia bacterium]|nr:ABC transporter permease [Blastocatellia bacterium]